MSAGRDDARLCYQGTIQTMAVADIAGRWYDRLNENGPNTPPVPFVDGKTSSNNHT